MPGTAPLRIHKAHSASSSDCSDMENDGLPHPAASRALADISITAGRRNSNNYSKMDGPYEDDIPSSSPFPSPYSTPNKTGASPLNFWHDKLQENMTPTGLRPSTSQRRTSVEKLKSRSQVSNNPFQNGSPSSTPIPTATRPKPISSRLPIPTSKQSTPFKAFATGASHISGYGSNPDQKPPPPKPFSILSPPRLDPRGNDPHVIISSPPRSSKQVTFTAAPQVQMFVPTTPEPSVSASENTYEDEDESDEDSEDDEDYNMPVVGPEDWDSEHQQEISLQPQAPEPVKQEPSLADLPSPSGRPLPPLPPADPVDAAPPRRLPLHERLELVMRSSSPVFQQEKRPSTSSQELTLEYFTADEEDEEDEEEEQTEEDTSEDEEEEEEGNESFSPVVLPEEVASDDEMSENDGLSRQLSFSSNKENIDVVRPEPPRRSAEDVLNSEFRIPRISRESIRRQVQANRDQPEEAPAFVVPEPVRQSAGAVGALTESVEQRPADFTVVDREITMDLQTLAAKLNAEQDDVEVLPNILNRQGSVRHSFIANPEVEVDDEYDSPLDHDDAESKYSTDSWSDHGDREPVYDADEGDEDEESEPPTPTQASFGGSLSNGNNPHPNPDIVEADMKDDLDLPEFQSLSIAEPAAATSESTSSSRTLVNGQPFSTDFLAVPGNQSDEDDLDDGMSICESVIRHDIYDSDDYDDESMFDAESIRARTPSPVPARRATIRSASGVRLTTRKSSAPADAATMAATRRIVSRAEMPPFPAVPPVPKIDPAFLGAADVQPIEAEQPQPEVAEERPSSSSSSEGTETDETIEVPVPAAEPVPTPEFKVDLAPELEPEAEDEVEVEVESELIPEARVETSPKKPSQLSLPSLGLDLNMGSSLSLELDRVMENQKRGYLMRENSKVVHASGRAESNVDAAKPAAAKKTQSWTVEPWQGSPGSSARRRSGRGDSLKKKDMGPARPQNPSTRAAKSSDLPIVEENENKDSVPSVPEEKPAAEETMAGDGAERGRLFVKVVAVKDLQLPLPPNESTYFCMTLDNGLHCVTTSWLELGKNAPIGQEFELIVLDDLEFQLTLQTKIAPPPVQVTVTEVPITPQQNPPKSKSKFGNLFSSPKKRREQERLLQQQQQLQRQQAAAAAAAQRQVKPPSAWDLLHNLVAKDGSFARSYISSKDYEAKAYGRPYTAEVTCFNEWAVEMSSVKGKKNVPIRKPPYKIGKLEIQMLFVPRLQGMTDVDLPKSMNAAIREIREAESVVNQTYEGYLSQQGGDCPYWRRRYFKLEGSRLTAYHESSRQLRANINLAKAVKVLDDRSTLTNSSGSKKRRKSGFAEDEEGYMFIEEGFRIRFANGECIDFYADSANAKNGWMKVLYDTIGRCSDGRNWCDFVLKKEREDKLKSPPPPPTPVKHSMIPTTPRTPVPKTPSHSRSQSATTPNFQQLGLTPMSATPGRTRAPLPPRSGRPQSHHGGMR